MKVVDPGGQVWHVHRRWLPWNPGKGRNVAENVDGLDFTGLLDGVNDLPGIAIAIVVGIVLVLLAPLIALVLLTGIELLLLLAVLPFAIAGRMLFGRRWWVQVRRGWRLDHEELGGDWTASGLRVQDLAHQIRLTPPAVAHEAA